MLHTRKLRHDVDASELRLNRSVASGKGANGAVVVQLTGAGKVKQIEIDQKALSLPISDEQVGVLGEAVAEAVEAALAKQRRRVSRELETLIG